MEDEIYYCKKCRSYVSVEDTVCPVCGTLFSDLISIDRNDLTEIMTFSNEFESELIKAKLREAGIESVSFHESAGEVIPSLNNAFGIKLYVHQNDAERAIKLLEDNQNLRDDMEEEKE
ncbi:MAG: DUF2007 domain-containing protein [Ignavibacteria bacterium]|jgi:hypothetical protein|nr:DUF2007 domain-containing protein [Ignavibacteria bacterium]